jgi:tetratricopeptide (TPR) repeat protein
MGVSTVTDDSFHQAQAFFNAGNYARARETALRGLEARPHDVELLRLAGKSSLELGLDDAVGYLQRVVNMRPDDVDAWHDLGDALVEEGRLREAAAALREVVQIKPRDATALVDLGHVLHALGEHDEAIAVLSLAAEVQPGNLTTLRSLVEMYRSTDQTERALEAAEQMANLQPDDVLSAMDVADLSLDLGRLDEAVAAYSRLRHIDAEDHEVYAYHGMINAEMQRERWRRALDLAIDATRIDRYGLTTDLLAFNVAQVFGASDRPVPSRAEVDAALAAERAEHRRLHTDELAL